MIELSGYKICQVIHFSIIYRQRHFHTLRMFKQTATDLTKVSNDLVKKWLDSFDTVLTDCDGKCSAKYLNLPKIAVKKLFRNFDKNLRHTILHV